MSVPVDLDFNFQVSRPTLEQKFRMFNIAVVAANSVPIAQGGSSTLNELYTSFVITAITNDVFLGDTNVTTTTGLTIPAGVPVAFSIGEVRQLYELQNPLWKQWISWLCNQEPPVAIPFNSFDLANWHLIGTANTTVNIMAFPAPFK